MESVAIPSPTAPIAGAVQDAGLKNAIGFVSSVVVPFGWRPDPPLKGIVLGSAPNKLLQMSERPVVAAPAS